MPNVTNALTLSAYEQVGRVADTAGDQQLRALVDQRVDLDRQVHAAHARVEELRAERERATGGITARVAQQALSGDLTDDDGDADVRDVATAAARVPAAEARLHGVRVAVDQLEARIEQHLAQHAVELQDALRNVWAEHDEHAAELERQAAAARAEADGVRLLIYAAAPGPVRRATVEGVTMPRRKPIGAGAGFDELAPLPPELLAAGAHLPGGRLEPSVAAHRKAEERLLVERAVQAGQDDASDAQPAGVASWQ